MAMALAMALALAMLARHLVRTSMLGMARVRHMRLAVQTLTIATKTRIRRQTCLRRKFAPSVGSAMALVLALAMAPALASTMAPAMVLMDPALASTPALASIT